MSPDVEEPELGSPDVEEPEVGSPEVEEPGVESAHPRVVDRPVGAPPRRRGALVPVLLVLVMLAAVAGALWTVQQVRDDRREDRADRAALDAGRTAAIAFTSYDFEHLDEDLQRVADMSTGTFKAQFTSALAALTDAIKEAQGVSKGRIAYAGLQERHDNTATVLVAADATIVNKDSPQSSVRRYRLQIVLNDASGAWLISDIKPVG